MMDRRDFLAAACALGAGCRVRKQAFGGYAFVANHGGKAVAVVDLSAFAVIRHIALDDAPTELAAPPARPFVYVLMPEAGLVAEIGVGDLRVRRRVSLDGRACGMRLDRGGGALHVLMGEPSPRLLSIDLDRMTIDSRVRLPAPPADFDLSRDEDEAVVSLGSAGALCRVDLRAPKCGKPVELGSPLAGVRYRKDGRLWLAAHAAENMLTLVHPASQRVVVKLPLALRPRHFCFKADGGELFLTGPGQDAVVIVFPYLTEVAETILAGNAPGQMAASHVVKDTVEYLFVSNPKAGQVTIVNVATRKVMAVAPTGAEPGAIVITPDNQYALVLNRQSGDMAVLLIQSAAKRQRFPAALFTMIPVGSAPVSAVVRGV